MLFCLLASCVCYLYRMHHSITPSPHHPSPFAAATKASDVYSFGVILWELLSRRVPFEGKNFTEMRTAVLRRKEKLVLPAQADLPHSFHHVNCYCLLLVTSSHYSLSHSTLSFCLCCGVRLKVGGEVYGVSC